MMMITINIIVIIMMIIIIITTTIIITIIIITTTTIIMTTMMIIIVIHNNNNNNNSLYLGSVWDWYTGYCMTHRHIGPAVLQKTEVLGALYETRRVRQRSNLRVEEARVEDRETPKFPATGCVNQSIFYFYVC